jgi:hypothetical protein
LANSTNLICATKTEKLESIMFHGTERTFEAAHKKPADQLLELLRREKGYVFFAELQSMSGLSHDDLVSGLREIYVAEQVDYMPGNGVGNSRYRLREPKLYKTTVAQATDAVLSNPVVSVQIIDAATPPAPAPVPAPAVTANAAAAPIASAIEVVVVAPVAQVIAPPQEKSTEVATAKTTAPRVRKAPAAQVEMDWSSVRFPAPSWANPLSEPVAATGVRLSKDKAVFELSRRPGGFTFTMKVKDARAWAKNILRLQDSGEVVPAKSIPDVHVLLPEKMTVVGPLVVIRLSARPGSNSVVISRYQAVLAAQRVLEMTPSR